MIKLDLSYLETISGGDKAFIREMLTMFLTSSFLEMQQLKSLTISGELERIGNIAHKMKAPIQMLGVPYVSDLVAEVEVLCRNKGDIKMINTKVEQLEVYMVDLDIAIKQYLST